MISEAASEKRQRGRPRAFGPRLLQFGVLFDTAKTERGRQNRLYALSGLSALSLESGEQAAGVRYRWLADEQSARQGKKSAIKWGILAELGRLAQVVDDATVLSVADQICARQPTVKEGIALIRWVRLPRSSPPDGKDLAQRLAGVIDEYRRTHPGTDWQTVLVALADIYAVVTAEKL
jgi:hypothetical protein